MLTMAIILASLGVHLLSMLTTLLNPVWLHAHQFKINMLMTALICVFLSALLCLITTERISMMGIKNALELVHFLTSMRIHSLALV